MFTVKTPEEASALIESVFAKCMQEEEIPLEDAPGRVLAKPVKGTEYVPGFDRSTVDGYAVIASDTFGCSDALPALLALCGEVEMGKNAERKLSKGECIYVPTGGAMPEGSDAAVMIEYTENYGDGTVGILKSAAPGNNLIFRGDDVSPGKEVLPAGRKLTAGDIGALAAMGISRVLVAKKPLVGIISTGDELVSIDETPQEGQIRDVNSVMLGALVQEAGAEYISYGILKDDEAFLKAAFDKALTECDMVLISGGSSVGMKDVTCSVLESRGEVLFHGLAMKPGKPTILGKADGRPVFGLPGHPAAACFVSELFVKPLLARMMGRTVRPRTVTARITEAVSANHGRAQYMGVTLHEENGILYAKPVHSKSGLITSLAGTDGFFCIPRDCEGISADETIQVRIYSTD